MYYWSNKAIILWVCCISEIGSPTRDGSSTLTLPIKENQL